MIEYTFLYFSRRPICDLRFRETVTTLTIRVQLVPVGHQSAVVPVIRYTIVVVVMVAGISLPVLVMVGLVAVGNVGTVVQRVLVAILVDVIVVVAHVTHQVAVRVELQMHIFYMLKKSACIFYFNQHVHSL